MPRSWRQSSRKLIAEIRETFRIYFRRVPCHTLDTSFFVCETTMTLGIPTDVFGGVLVTPRALLRSVPTPILTTARRLWLDVVPGVICQLLIVPPAVCVDRCLSTASAVLMQVPMISRRIAVCFQTIQSFAARLADPIGSRQLTLPKPPRPRPYRIPGFQRPKTGRLYRLRTRAHRFAIRNNPIPIVRTPIPPHRFALHHRNRFRDMLARVAQVPATEIQLIGVYDRVYLSMYQSVSQKDNGTLLCIPKPGNDPDLHQREHAPVYLILGKSFQRPGQLLRAVLPMKDLTS